VDRPQRYRIPLSTIGRPVDPRFPTNRAILILVGASLVGSASVLFAIGRPLSEALLRALSLAGAVFFAWALARETDPDRPGSAFLAAAGAAGGALLLGTPRFLLLLWVLLGLRVVNRSTGLSPGALDWVAIYGIKLWLGFSAHWTIPLLALPTLLFAGLRRFPVALRVGLPLALPAAAIAFGALHAWRFALPAPASVEFLLLLGVAVGVVPAIVSYRRVRSVGDRTGVPLEPHRVQWGLGWAVTAGAILTLSGTGTVGDLAPLWAALAGTGLGWVGETVFRRRRREGIESANGERKAGSS